MRPPVAEYKADIRRRHLSVRLAVFCVQGAISVVLSMTTLTLLAGLTLVVWFEQGEMEVPFAAEIVERRLALRYEGAEIDIDGLTILRGEGDRPTGLSLQGLTITDRWGGTFQADALVADVVLSDLMLGAIRPKAVSVRGLSATLRRTETGCLILRRGEREEQLGGCGPALHLFPAMQDLLDVGALMDRIPELRGLERIALEDLDLRFEDELGGAVWQIAGSGLAVRDDAVTLRISGDLEASGGTAGPITLDVVQAPGGETSLGATFADLAPSDLASIVPALAVLTELHALVSGQMSLRADADDVQLRGALELGAGHLGLGEGRRPLRFSDARTRFQFAGAERRFALTDLVVHSDWGEAIGGGLAYLTEDGGVVAQVAFDRLHATPPQLPARVEADRAWADFRIRFNPLRVDLGQAMIAADGAEARLSGTVAFGEVPTAALDAQLTGATVETVVEMWPPQVASQARAWFVQNVREGRILHATGGLRREGDRYRRAVSLAFAGARAHTVPRGLDLDAAPLPDLRDAAGYASIDGEHLHVTVTEGALQTSAGRIDLAGSALTMALGSPSLVAEIDIAAAGSAAAGLTALEGAPLRLMTATGLSADFAAADATATGRISLPLRLSDPSQIDYDIAATLTDVTSRQVVPGWTARAERLALSATPDRVTVSGAARFDDVPVRFDYARSLAPGTESATVTADAEVSPRALEALGIALPPGTISGATPSAVALRLPDGRPPEFELASTLEGLAIRIPSLGWSKSAAERGSGRISGTAGRVATVDGFELIAPGIRAEGTLDLDAQGLVAARFDRVAVGALIDGRVRIEGQTPDRIVIQDAVIDLREIPAGDVGGPAPVIRLAGANAIVADGMILTDLQGTLTPAPAGYEGIVVGKLNGGAPVTASVAPGNLVRLRVADGGRALREARIFPAAHGGSLIVDLAPEGTAIAVNFRIDGTTVRDAPAMARLLSAISGIGLVEQLGTGGIHFSTVEGRALLGASTVEIRELRALGPSMGITAEGRYSYAGSLDLEGVISPFYGVTGAIQRVPLLGRVLGGRRGEGTIGFTYQMSGSATAPVEDVNPMSLLTPGIFREIFRRNPPQAQGNGT